MFAPTKSSCTMQLGNVKTLVEWKLCVFVRLILGSPFDPILFPLSSCPTCSPLPTSSGERD